MHLHDLMLSDNLNVNVAVVLLSQLSCSPFEMWHFKGGVHLYINSLASDSCSITSTHVIMTERSAHTQLENNVIRIETVVFLVYI